MNNCSVILIILLIYALTTNERHCVEQLEPNPSPNGICFLLASERKHMSAIYIHVFIYMLYMYTICI